VGRALSLLFSCRMDGRIIIHAVFSLAVSAKWYVNLCLASIQTTNLFLLIRLASLCGDAEKSDYTTIEANSG
jgi:hypothetical protein